MPSFDARNALNSSRGRPKIIIIILEIESFYRLKRKKDKDTPRWEGQRSLVGLFLPPAKRVGKCTAGEPWRGVLVEHAREL